MKLPAAAEIHKWECTEGKGTGRISTLEFNQQHPAYVDPKSDSIIQTAF